LKSLVDAQLCERTGHDLPAVLSATKELLEGQSPLARWRATTFDDLEDVFLL
jgi:hypothetical protein